MAEETTIVSPKGEANNEEEKLGTSPGKRTRARAISRIFGHLMDLGGGHEAGTWIVGILYLDSTPTDERLKQVVEERLLSMPRFRSRLVVHSSGGHYEELGEDEFDWEYHLSKAFEGETIGQEQLMKYIGDFYESDIDMNKPLWKLILIPQMEDGRACLLTVINHGIADGVASVGVLLKLLDDAPVNPTLPAKDQDGFVPTKRSKKPDVSLASRIGMFFAGVQEGLFGAFGRADNTTILKPTKKVSWIATKKVLATGDQISLDKVKEVKNKFPGATVNDILIAMLTMTVKEFFVEMGEPAAGKKAPIRGNFPVSTRSRNEPILDGGDPRNLWSAVAFRFPFDYTDPIDCVFKVKKKLDKLKVSPQIHVAKRQVDVLIKTLPRKTLLDKVVQLNAKATAMLSNVPGPQQKVHLAGVGIDDMTFFLFSPLNVYLGIITYNGKVSIGVNFGEDLKQDPAALAKHWKVSFDTLYEEAMKYDGLIEKKPSLRKKAESTV